MADPISLPDFYTWAAAEPGYGTEAIREEIIRNPGLAHAMFGPNADLTKIDVPAGPELVRRYLAGWAKLGHTGAMTQLQGLYLRAGDRTAAQLGTEIAAAQGRHDSAEVARLEAQGSALAQQMPTPARFSAAVSAATSYATQHPSASADTVAHGAPASTPPVSDAPPSAVGTGPASAPRPLAVTAGDLRASVLAPALQNLLGGEASRLNSGNTTYQMEGLPIAGAGPAVTADQFTIGQPGATLGDAPTAPATQAIDANAAIVQATPQTDPSTGQIVVPQIAQANAIVDSLSSRNRFLAANGATRVDTSNLTIAGIPASGVMSIAQAVKVPLALTDEQYVRFQQNLIAAGLYGNGDPSVVLENNVRWGDRSDPATMSAWENLIAQSAATGTSIAATLQNKQAAYMPLLQRSVATTKANAVASLVGDLHLTSPDDVKAAAQAAFANALGRAPTETELAQLVAGYHGTETAAHGDKVAAATAAVSSTNLFENSPVGNAAALGATPVGDIGERFLAVVRDHESGGNYASPSGPGHWAGGAYQIMRDTWNGYGGYARAELAPPAVQDAKARTMLAGIQGRTSDPGVWGLWWYNPAAAERYLRGDTGVLNEAPPENHGYRYGQYYDDIIRRMGQGALGAAQLGGVQTGNALTADTGLNIGPSSDPFSSQVVRAAGRGATIHDAPSAAAYAEEQARTAHPTEYAAKGLGSEYYQLLSLLRGNLPTGASGG